MEVIIIFVSLLISIGVSCIFGAITHAIHDSKGYSETGFWWGFWLGWIGIIVVACKPNINEYYYSRRSGNGPSPVVTSATVPQGGWRCSCGRTHAGYVSSCVCGLNKNQLTTPAKPASSPSAAAPVLKSAPPESEADKIAVLRQYKELLDSGVLTQEEFEKKKQQLLK